MNSNKYGAELMGKSGDIDPEKLLKPGYSYWIEYGVYYQAPTVDPVKFGPHDYAQPGGHYLDDCKCGCKMYSSSSSGDCDPFGACPENPNPFAS